MMQSEQVSNGGYHEMGVANGCKRDKQHTISKLIVELRRRGKRQARFAHAAWAWKGQQAHLGTAEQRTDTCCILFASQERGEMGREIEETNLHETRGSIPLRYSRWSSS